MLSPLIPVMILLVGAASLGLGLWPRFRFTGLVASLAAALALAALLAVGLRLPQLQVVSAWGPPPLLIRPLALNVDALAWPLGVSLLTLTLAALLTGVVRPGGRRVLVRAAILLIAFSSLAALFTDSIMTRVLAWAGLDLIYFLTLLLQARGDDLEQQAVLSLGFNATGTLLALGAAVLISRESPTLSVRDVVLSPQSTLLITLAAAFRLGLFPLHLSLPAEANIRQGLGALLRLAPAAVALELLARLAVMGFAPEARVWLAGLGLAAALVGAAQLWNVDDPRLGLTYLVIAESGLALLAGMWGGGGALMAQSLALVLGGGLVYLSNGHDVDHPWRSAPAVFGVAVLAGLPLTVGWLGLSNAWWAMAAAGAWWALVPAFGAQILVVAGALRVAFSPGEPIPSNRLAAGAYAAGLGSLGLGAVAAAAALTTGQPPVAPGGLLGLAYLGRVGAGLGMLGLAAGLGVAAWRWEGGLRERAVGLGAALGAVARLQWLYRLAWTLVRSAATLVRSLADILEGEGALLWTLVAALLIWLAFR